MYPLEQRAIATATCATANAPTSCLSSEATQVEQLDWFAGNQAEQLDWFGGLDRNLGVGLRAGPQLNFGGCSALKLGAAKSDVGVLRLKNDVARDCARGNFSRTVVAVTRLTQQPRPR